MSSSSNGRPASAPNDGVVTKPGQEVVGTSVYTTPVRARNENFRAGMLTARHDTAAGDPSYEPYGHPAASTVESLRPRMRVEVARAPGFTPEAATQANGRIIKAVSGHDDAFWDQAGYGAGDWVR